MSNSMEIEAANHSPADTLGTTVAVPAPPGTKSPEPRLTVGSLFKERAGLLVLSVFLITINRAAGLVLPYTSKYLVDNVVVHRARSALLLLVVSVAGATVLQALTSFLITKLLLNSTQRLVADLRKRIYWHVARLPVAFFDGNKTGSIVSRVMNDVEGIRNLMGPGLFDFVGGILTALLALIVLVHINVLMTLVVFSVLVLFGFLLRPAFLKYRPVFKESSAIMAEVMGRLTESFSGIRVTKAYRAENQERAVFSSAIDRLLSRVLTTSGATAIMSLATAVVTGLVGAIVMYLGAVAVIDSKMTLGDLFRYVMFLGLLVTPLIQVVSIGTAFNEAVAGLERVQQVLEQPREDQEKNRTVALTEMRGDIRFEHVSFAYSEDKYVLRDISLHAEPGTVTALVGTSGAGKSTIIGLIAGFYNVSDGTIRIDGEDLSGITLDSYRSFLGLVPQDPFLFSGTVRDNVAFGRQGATEDEIREACRIAHVEEFVGRLEKGYETVVGERGVKLSAGQRQRISIARAVLANPKLLILDEATSSLDFESEAIIQTAIAYLLRDRTTFVIAHRLSTIRRADQILVIENGRVLERGTHESLYQSQGRYWDLYQKQYYLEKNLFLAPGEGGHLPQSYAADGIAPATAREQDAETSRLDY